MTSAAWICRSVPRSQEERESEQADPRREARALAEKSYRGSTERNKNSLEASSREDSKQCCQWHSLHDALTGERQEGSGGYTNQKHSLSTYSVCAGHWEVSRT